MIQQFDRVMLNTDLPEFGLKSGDVGTVVDIYGNHEGYEIEFISIEGEQIAVATLMPNQVSEIGNDAISVVSVRQRVK
jgi:hypothetical protein